VEGDFIIIVTLQFIGYVEYFILNDALPILRQL